MKFAYLSNNIVKEVIPKFNPAFPNIPIEDRYSSEFLDNVVEAPDDVVCGQLYVRETGTFEQPPEPVIDDSVTTTYEEPESFPYEPNAEDVTLELLADHEERLCMLELTKGE